MDNSNHDQDPKSGPTVVDPLVASSCVLVVDDSRTLRRILIRELNSLGLSNIKEASDGLEAIEIINTSSIDLMLLDMEMPELDGLGVLQALKSEGSRATFPIIVISGGDAFDKTIKCIEIGSICCYLFLRTAKDKCHPAVFWQDIIIIGIPYPRLMFLWINRIVRII